MDNKKIVTVAVLAVLALAFAGYGYADYTASTYNAGNNVEVNYITVTPGQWNAIVAAEEVELDTYTFGLGDNKVLYTLAEDEDLEIENGYAQLGEDYTLTITDGTTKTFEKYKIDITVQGTIATAENFKLYLAYDDNADNYLELKKTMSIDEVSSDVTLKLLMKIDGYTETISFPTGSGWEEITGTLTGPGVTTPLLAGDDQAAEDAPQGTATGAIFIFKVTPIDN